MPALAQPAARDRDADRASDRRRRRERQLRPHLRHLRIALGRRRAQSAVARHRQPRRQPRTEFRARRRSAGPRCARPTRSPRGSSAPMANCRGRGRPTRSGSRAYVGDERFPAAAAERAVPDHPLGRLRRACRRPGPPLLSDVAAIRRRPQRSLRLGRRDLGRGLAQPRRSGVAHQPGRGRDGVLQYGRRRRRPICANSPTTMR